MQAATEHGAHATLTTVAAPTPIEMHLYANGFPEFAQALRSARLMTSSAGLPDWLHRLQVQLNMPLLMAAAATLLAHLQADDRRGAVFASRDGRHLKGMFDAMRAAAGLTSPTSRYWYTSRCARTGGQRDYLEYCRTLFAARPMLVDLCGTGASIARLFDALSIVTDRPPVFFCEFVDDEPQQTRMQQAYGVPDAPPLQVSSLLSTHSFVNNEVLELLNATSEGMVRGVCRVGGGFVPVRDESEFDGEVALLVRSQMRWVQDFTANLQSRITPTMLDEITSQGPQLLSLLHDAAVMVQSDLQTLAHTMLPAHRRNEAVVLRDLLQPSPAN